jgi:hypothetical protein
MLDKGIWKVDKCPVMEYIILQIFFAGLHTSSALTVTAGKFIVEKLMIAQNQILVYPIS